MKEEWLLEGAAVPVTCETVTALVAEIHRLIGVVGGMALAQPEQEPVAWMVYTQDGQSVYVTDNPTDIQEGQRALPLYTTPPQRTWVGLTDEEVKQLCLAVGTEPIEVRLIKAKLKERNT